MDENNNDDRERFRNLDRKQFMTYVSSRQILTPGMVGRALGVSSRTVNKWCDVGYVRCYRIPGSKDRRITMLAFREFLRENKIDVAGIGLSESVRVLHVYWPGPSPRMTNVLGLFTASGWKVACFDNPVVLGWELNSGCEALLVDGSVGTAEVAWVIDGSTSRCKGLPVVCLDGVVSLASSLCDRDGVTLIDHDAADEAVLKTVLVAIRGTQRLPLRRKKRAS